MRRGKNCIEIIRWRRGELEWLNLPPSYAKRLRGRQRRNGAKVSQGRILIYGHKEQISAYKISS